EGPPLLQMGSGRGKLSGKEQGGPQRVVGLQEERRVVGLLGHGEELLSQRPRPLVLAAVVIKSPETPQHREELWGLAQLRRRGNRVIGMARFRAVRPFSHLLA